jgi:hypothetical protein
LTRWGFIGFASLGKRLVSSDVEIPQSRQEAQSVSIEQYVPAGYTFGEMHDTFVDAATRAGIPDLLANIPSMIPMYGGAVVTEALRTLGILEQPTPPTLCK